MEGFCPNCGEKILEGYKVCGNCGTPVDQVAAPAAPVAPAEAPAAYNPQPAAAKKPPFALIGVAVVAIIAIIAVIAGVSGNGYKKPIKNMAKAFEEGEYDLFEGAYSNLYYDALDDMLSGYGFDVDYSKGMKNVFKARVDYLEDECGKDYKVKVEFGDKEKYDKDEIEDLIEEFEEDDGIEYDGKEIKKLYEVEFVITAEGDDGDEDILEATAYIVKTDEGWGILGFDESEWCEYEEEEY